MNINNKKIAVCIMTYNRIDFLKKALSSVLDSDFHDFNIYVFNDNSNDGTEEFLNSPGISGAVTAINCRDNMGQFKLANYIIENVKSEYTVFLHDDDMLGQNHLKTSFELAEADKDIAFIGTGWKSIDENGGLIQEFLYKNFKNKEILNDADFIYHHIRGLQFPWSGTLIRMEKIKDIRFDYNYKNFADTQFMINLSRNNKVGYIPEILFSYRIHKEQISSIKSFEIIYSDWLKIFAFYHDYLTETNNTRDNFKALKKANTETNFANMLKSPDFKYFFKILFGFKYFNIFLLDGINWLKIMHKFLRLCVGKKQNG